MRPLQLPPSEISLGLDRCGTRGNHWLVLINWQHHLVGQIGTAKSRLVPIHASQEV